MKVLLEIKDNKADFVLELLNSLSYVKAMPIKTSKEKYLEGLQEAIDEVKLAKQGKIKLQLAKDFLNEL